MPPDPRYPIGAFQPVLELTASQRRSMIEQIAETPARLRRAIIGLSQPELDTPYRKGGWTVRQVVHHLPDSHVNAYIRLKLALTEEEPTIKPYDESAWATLPDSEVTTLPTSVKLLEALHSRFTTLLRSMEPEDFRRTFRHPDHGVVNIDWLVAMYAWHGRHHVAHITSLRERLGW